jgi:hypothetical protein
VEDAEAAPGAVSRRRARWPLVAGVGLALTVVAGCAVLTGRLVHHDPSGLPTIVVGTCLSSTDLAAGRSDLSTLDAVSCGATHDAEVFALRTLGADEELDSVGERCLTAAEDLGINPSALHARDLEVRPLALSDAAPAAGDTVACFVRHKGGTPLRGAVFTTGSDQ